MKESTKNNFFLPLIVVFIGVFILTPIANAYYDPNKKDIPFITPILKFLSFLWNDVFNYKISIWIVLIVLIIILIVISSYRKYKENQSEIYDSLEPEKSKPAFLNWTKGKFKRWMWVWEWYYNPQTNHYEVSGITPICHNCNFKMYKDNGYSIYICPNCENVYGGDHFENYYDIKSIIIQKIEMGDYPKD